MTEAEQEHARIRALVQAKVRRLADLGRARDADRWRAFSEWLRVEAPPKEKGRQITPPAPFAPYVNTQTP